MARSKFPKKFIAALLPPAFWLGAWQLGALLLERHLEGRGNELLLPYPATVAAALWELAGTPSFWATVAVTLGRVWAGLLGGVLLGCLLAPPIRVVRATPVASFILLVLLWTGRGRVPAVIAGLMVLPVVWENLVRGIRSTDPQLLELARAYRFSRGKTVSLIYLPSLRPHFLSALTTSMGLAWKSGVAAEAICWPRPGIGTQIYNAKLYLEIPQLFAWTAVVAALSLILERLLGLLLERWKGGVRT